MIYTILITKNKFKLNIFFFNYEEKLCTESDKFFGLEYKCIFMSTRTNLFIRFELNLSTLILYLLVPLAEGTNYFKSL